LRTICANPEDDTVRLVYADWLDENGDPERAEFIRVSIQWACAPHPSERWILLRDRVTELVKLNKDRWLGELPPAGITWEIGFPWSPFDRGFPAVCAILNGWAFTEGAEELFALAPIEHLVFPRVSFTHILQALACPAVAGITGFTIVRHPPNPPGDELCEVLARPNHLHRLRFLPLGRMGITDTGLAALAQAPFLPLLRQVMLDGNPVSETGLLGVVNLLSPGTLWRLALPRAALAEHTRQRLAERFRSQLVLG
jgi:uncharacterized protein (TIGR02996 family)